MDTKKGDTNVPPFFVSDDPVLSNFRHYGFFDSPAKPFRVEDLDGALRRVLDARCRLD
jgi:hypothetical protein